MTGVQTCALPIYTNRDTFDQPYGPELANRGYRVLAINYRGDRDAGEGPPEHYLPSVSRGIAYKAVAQTQGPVASTASSLMKLGITEMMFDIAMLRGDISGAEAMLEGADATGMLAAPGGRIAGGSSQVQRNIIGERLLGLPREPK